MKRTKKNKLSLKDLLKSLNLLLSTLRDLLMKIREKLGFLFRRISGDKFNRLPQKRQRLFLRIGLILIVIFLPVAIFLARNAFTAKGAWSPEHRLWSKRKVLTIKNDAPDSLASGTTVAVSVDTKTLAEKNDLQDDCDDLRVVYSDDGSTWTELDRYVSYPSDTTCGVSSSTKVYFQLQEAVSASSSANPYYYMYYGNDKAETPTSTINAFDTTSANALLVCPFDGDTDCINADGLEEPTTETGAIRYSGEKTAMSFDGESDEVYAANSTSIQNLPNTNFTAEAWIYLEKEPEDDWDYKVIMSKDVSNNYRWHLAVRRNEDVNTRLFATIQNVADSSSEEAISLNTWHHVAMTYNGTGDKKIYMYLDGSEVTYHSQTAMDTTYDGDESYNLTVGALDNGGSSRFVGKIDEVRVSNVIRYDNNFTPQTSPFVRDEYTKLLLHFDEGGNLPTYSGYAYDDSGNNNHGLITGAKYATGLVGVDTTSEVESSNTSEVYTQSYAGHQGIFLEEGTTNLIKNPSFDHSTFNTLWSDEEDDSTVFNLSTASATFTPNMAKRSAPGPFTAAPIAQGDFDTSGTGDVLTGTGSEISNRFYTTHDRNQGSIVFWITPEWDGDDGLRHDFYNAGPALAKTETNGLAMYLPTSTWSEEVDISSWTAGSTYMVVASWDTNNTINGTDYVRISVDNVHTYGETTQPTTGTGNTFRIGQTTGDYAANAIIEGLTVYRRVLYDGTYGIDVGNGDEIEQIYGGGTSPQDPTLTTGSWDVVFALPTNSSTGTLSTGTGEAWSHPHSSNLLTNGFFMDDPVFDGWSLEGSPSATGSAATAQKIFAGGGYITSDSANEGIYQDITVSAGDDWVIRAIAHSDGTATPSAILYDQSNGAEIGSLTATDSASTRADPEVFIFTGEAPTDCTTLRVKLINTNSSGTVYWHQVEVLSNLISNPSMEGTYDDESAGGGGTINVASGFNNSQMETDSTDTADKDTGTYHSGNASQLLEDIDNNEGVASAYTVSSGNYYSAGGFLYVSTGEAALETNQGSRLINQDGYLTNTNSVTSTNAWYHRAHVLRHITDSAAVTAQSATSSNTTFNVDDYYLFTLDDVSLTVTPASEENSAEDWGLRVDGRDTLTQTITGLTATEGTIRFRYTPRHDASTMCNFGSDSDDAEIAHFYYDSNNRITLYWIDCNTLQFFYNMNGTNDQTSWDATGAISAGTTYEIEITYSGGDDMVLKVDDDIKITLSDIPSAFSNTPTIAYWGSTYGDTKQADAVFSDPASNPGSGNITDTAETSAPYYKFGSKSAKLVAGANDYYSTRSLVSGGTSYALSAYVYDGTSGNIGGEVDNTVAQLVFEGENISGTTYTDQGGGWWRLTHSASAGRDGVQHFGVYSLNGKTIYVDAVQLEELSHTTSYTDGSLGTGFSWSSTSHESTSNRTSTYQQFSASNNINVDIGSISFWYKPNWNGSEVDDTQFRFLHTGSTDQGFFCIYLGDWGGSEDIRIYFYDDLWNLEYASAPVTITKDEWIHIVGTWDNTTGANVYINSTAGTPNTTTWTADNSIPNFSVGSHYNGESEHPNGTIVDFRIYDNSLTSTEVADLYYSGLVSHSEGIEVERHDDAKGQAPVAVWHFDEGYGTTAHDSSMYGNDLIISDATSSGDLQSSNPRAMNLQFDGVHSYLYRNPTDTDLLFDDDSFSVSGWFKHPSSISETDTIISQYGDSSTGDAGGWKIYMNSSGYICAALDDDNTWGPDDEICSASAQGSYGDSRWHHFSAVRHSEQSEESLKLYVDGQLVAEDDNISATGSLNNNASIYVGIDSDGSSNLWSGFLDEIIIYPYARSSDQIKTDSTGGPHQTSAVFGTETEDWLTEGLVGYWDMEDSAESEGQIVTDQSGNGNHGTLYGDDGVDDNGSGMTATASGKFGTSAEFDGTDDYVFITGPDLSSGSFTYGLWLYQEGNSNTDHQQWFQNGGYRNFAINSDPTGYESFNLWVNGNRPIQYSGSNPIPFEEWAHVTITFDAQKGLYTLYVNGDFVASGEESNPSSSSTWNIGRNTIDIQYFEGYMDEVRIYNRALSPTEVQKLYNWAPGPVGYWKMDEASWNGTTNEVKDSSGNGNHGTADEHDGGTIPTTDHGKFGNAGYFNGDNGFINIDSSVSNDLSYPFTISGWFYVDENATGSNTIYSETSTGDSTQYLQLRVSDSSILYQIYDFGGTSMSAVVWTDYRGAWHYVTAISRAENDHELYIDGQSIQTSSTIPTVSKGFDRTVIGAVAFGTSQQNYFDGKIDDLKVYNYVRTQEQIIEDMNAGHPAPGSPVGSAVGHWKFDEGYGDTAHDSSPQGNNGDLAGSGTTCPQSGDSACPSWSNNGKFGKALDFDTSGTTDDYVSLGSPNNLDDLPLVGLTASAWIKPDSSADYSRILDKRTAGAGWSFYYRNTGNIGTSINGVTTAFDTTTNTVVNQQWNHVVLTYDPDNNNINLFINGVKSATKTGTSSYTTDAAENLTIGARGDASALWFNGMIDEVQIFNSALTADQIKLLYNQGSAAVWGATSSNTSGTGSYDATSEYCPPGSTDSCTSPVAEWNFDEGSGTSVNDTSENNNTGTFGDGTCTEGNGSCPKWANAEQVPYNASGLGGKVLEFDGSNDRVTLSNLPSTTTPYTISLWMMPQELNRTQSLISLRGSNTYPKFRFGGTNKLLLYAGAQKFVFSDKTWTSAELNQWWHVTFVMGSSDVADLKIYVNGEDSSGSTGANTETYYEPSSSGTIGDNNGNERFNGLIDQVRIYDYARTPAQIAWSYNRGSPIGHWTFDEGAGTSTSTVYDSSGNENNGTLNLWGGGNTATASARVAGKINDAIDFDGEDDYINLGNPTELQVETQTICAWVKTTDQANYIYSNRSALAGGASLFIASDGYLELLIGQTNANSTSNNTVNSGAWRHVCATFDDSSNTVIYYLDGKNDGTTINTGTFSHTVDKYIGYRVDGAAWHYFDGQIDDVRIYNYALTQQQINDIYNQGAVRFGP